MTSFKEENILTVAFINIRGQSGLPISKQLQIQSFIKYNNCDIIHLQEAHIDDESFSTCDFISSNFNIVPNNSLNKYGTASLVKSEFEIENIQCDNQGRVIIRLSFSPRTHEHCSQEMLGVTGNLDGNL
jgi:exonuclease III